MLFQFGRALPMATVCTLNFSLPGREDPISCKIKVRRVEELTEGDQYRIGASIVQMKPGNKGALKTFIRSLADLNADVAN